MSASPRAALLVLSAILLGSGELAVAEELAARIERIDYRGWADSWRIRNDACEVVIVPAVSRVMHFSLRDGKNVLFNNPALRGKTVPVDPKEWQNFGGEKLWPTEQKLFPKYTSKAWPPPWPWDGGSSEVREIPGGVRMRLPHDPRFGAHAIREFTLDPSRARLRIHQWIEKTDGQPVQMTCWTVTQTDDPVLALLPLGARAADGARFYPFDKKHPLMAEHSTVVTLGRHETEGLKIGVRPDERRENGWAAATFVHPKGALMLVQSHWLEREPAYPDEGCDAEIYTHPARELKYTELELLSPLATLKAGDKLAGDVIWQLVPISNAEAADAEAAANAARAAHREAKKLLRQD